MRPRYAHGILTCRTAPYKIRRLTESGPRQLPAVDMSEKSCALPPKDMEAALKTKYDTAEGQDTEVAGELYGQHQPPLSS